MKKGSLLVLVLLGLVGCSDPPRTNLNDAERKLFDSLYAQQATYVRDRVDSMCKANEKRYFNEYVDSLKQDYIDNIDEIENYLKSEK